MAKTCTLCGKRTTRLHTVNDGGPQHYCGLCYRGYVQTLKAPERIRIWVEREFNPKYHDAVFAELLDVATGTRIGNTFCREALKKIFPETA